MERKTDMEYKKHHHCIRQLISMPFVWAVLIPLIFADIILEIYHRICFPLYSIPYVKRSNYIRIDRHKLEYLNWAEKIGCAYCGYANGWLHYATIISAETEQYWCGIRHKKYKGFIEQSHHEHMKFTAYGDEKAFRKRYCEEGRKQ